MKRSHADNATWDLFPEMKTKLIAKPPEGTGASAASCAAVPGTVHISYFIRGEYLLQVVRVAVLSVIVLAQPRTALRLRANARS
jgi:hypothetical protein